MLCQFHWQQFSDNFHRFNQKEINRGKLFKYKIWLLITAQLIGGDNINTSRMKLNRKQERKKEHKESELNIIYLIHGDLNFN